MPRISESYILTIDMSDGDKTVMSIAKPVGRKLIVINSLYGEHAEQMYEKLTNIPIEGRK